MLRPLSTRRVPKLFWTIGWSLAPGSHSNHHLAMNASWLTRKTGCPWFSRSWSCDEIPDLTSKMHSLVASLKLSADADTLIFQGGHRDWVELLPPRAWGLLAETQPYRGNTGIGFITAKELLKKNCKVYIACRSEARAKDAIVRLVKKIPAAEGKASTSPSTSRTPSRRDKPRRPSSTERSDSTSSVRPPPRDPSSDKGADIIYWQLQMQQ